MGVALDKPKCTISSSGCCRADLIIIKSAPVYGIWKFGVFGRVYTPIGGLYTLCTSDPPSEARPEPLLGGTEGHPLTLCRRKGLSWLLLSSEGPGQTACLGWHRGSLAQRVMTEGPIEGRIWSDGAE